jgi:hypothetical protein
MKLELASGEQLLLEDIGQGRIFGVPGLLSHELPSIGEQLVELIIRPVLLPILEKAQPTQVRHLVTTPVSQLVILPAGSRELSSVEPTRIKAKTRPAILPGIITQPPIPEEIVEVKPKLLQVNYQLSKLKKMLGRHASDEDINRIQEAIYKV